MSVTKHITELILKYFKGELSEEERAELDSWRVDSPENKLFLNRLKDSGNIEQEFDELLDEDEIRAYKKLINQIRKATVHAPSYKIAKLSYCRAAIIFLCWMGPVLYLLNENKRRQANAQSQNVNNNSTFTNENGKTALILADGTRILLDNCNNDLLLQQGTTRITCCNGVLCYRKTTTSWSQKELMYNTLVTPHTGQWQVILPDGSKVWLNGASSVRFPVEFSGNERNVELTGEAYFEVASLNTGSAKKKFTITVKKSGEPNAKIEVLGTHFNISAYDDQAVIKTTLLEGSVKIYSGEITAFLKPGQQAQVNNSAVTIMPDADIAGVMAWKNNKFVFNNVPVETAIMEVARWYNYQVVFADNVPWRIGFTCSRSYSISEILHGIEKVGPIHFILKHNKIIVTK